MERFWTPEFNNKVKSRALTVLADVLRLPHELLFIIAFYGCSTKLMWNQEKWKTEAIWNSSDEKLFVDSFNLESMDDIHRNFPDMKITTSCIASNEDYEQRCYDLLSDGIWHRRLKRRKVYIWGEIPRLPRDAFCVFSCNHLGQYAEAMHSELAQKGILRLLKTNF
jgi:hypothetical protein